MGIFLGWGGERGGRLAMFVKGKQINGQLIRLHRMCWEMQLTVDSVVLQSLQASTHPRV